MSEANKAIARLDFEEIWSNQNLDVVDELYPEDHVRHDPADPQGGVNGVEAYKQLVAGYFRAFPDLHFTVDDMIAEGDKVVTRWTATGTHKGELMDIPPTGTNVSVTGISIQRIENGKVLEEWVNWDTMGLMQQLGVIPG